MPRSHKPRRRYVPKRVDLDPVGLAISGAATLTAAQRASLIAPLELAFTAFRLGRGSVAAWRDLADAMNVAEVLAELNIANDHAEKFEAGQAALAAVHERSIAPGRGSYTLYSREIAALDDALFMHRIQLDYCSQGELQNAIDTVKRRVAGALSGSPPSSARMCVPGTLGTPV